ncbi:hypothetical protein D3C77_353130 [compost metagenome]
MHGYACACHRRTDSLITTAFVDAVFFIQVQRLHLIVAADLQQHIGSLVPGIGLTQQQGNVQRRKLLAELRQIT